jgi:hypothetical protein
MPILPEEFLLNSHGSFFWRAKTISMSLVDAEPVGLFVGLIIILLLLALMVGGFFFLLHLGMKIYAAYRG